MPTGGAVTARAAPAASSHSLGWGAVTAGVTARSPEGERRLPKSKVRKKSVYTPPEGVLQSRAAQVRVAQPSPRWYAPLMVALMVIGLLWIVVYYVAGDRIPFMVTLGAWNFAIGFGAMVAGLVMSMRWR
jgi:hypothetical protein